MPNHLRRSFSLLILLLITGAGLGAVTVEEPVREVKNYRVATNSFIAEGGDLYQVFLQVKPADTGTSLSDLVMEYFQKHEEIQPPNKRRLIPEKQ